MSLEFNKLVFDVNDKNKILQELRTKLSWIYFSNRTEEEKNRIFEIIFTGNDPDEIVQINHISEKKKLLTVGILSTPDRLNFLFRLLEHIQKIIYKIDNPRSIQILLNISDRDKTTGKKRNEIIDYSTGEYTCFIDDDDLVSDDYFLEIINSLKANKDIDAVGFYGNFFANEKFRWTFVHSNKLTDNGNKRFFNEKGIFHSCINHLNPIKTSLIHDISFQDIWFGEDARWWEQIVSKKLIKNEILIEKVLYLYLWRGHENQPNDPRKK